MQTHHMRVCRCTHQGLVDFKEILNIFKDKKCNNILSLYLCCYIPYCSCRGNHTSVSNGEVRRGLLGASILLLAMGQFAGDCSEPVYFYQQWGSSQGTARSQYTSISNGVVHRGLLGANILPGINLHYHSIMIVYCTEEVLKIFSFSSFSVGCCINRKIMLPT